MLRILNIAAVIVASLLFSTAHAQVTAAGSPFAVPSTLPVTATSAELRTMLSDETGTGAAVFADTPTLIAPLLGTPTSAVLTNATGLPVSTGVSGLGANVATALGVAVGSAGAPVTFNGAGGTPSSIVLTNATGTAAGVSIGGVAATATALAADPADCGANTFANAINASGTLSCVAVPFAATTGVATSAQGALADTAVQPGGALGTPSSGVVTNLTGTAAGVSIGGNAATATALAANPSDCSANQYANAIAANGNLTCAQPATASTSDYAAGSWTPAVSCGGGTITTLGAVSGTYTKIGRMVFLDYDVNITTIGTCGTFITIGDFPYTVGVVSIGHGLENNVTGYVTRGLAATGGTSMSVRYYDASFPGASGARLIGHISYIQ